MLSAHAHGIAVIAWGVSRTCGTPSVTPSGPHADPPVARPDGAQVDGYSADIEEATEGVMLSAATRLGLPRARLRQTAGSRLVVATVYPPTDANWNGGYPYRAMAPYVDAFAPMVYWECTDPGTDATQDVARLSTLRPVHLIGEAFNFAGTGGRTVSPSGPEIAEFLTAGKRFGALGSSFWVWQEATPEEWSAVAGFPWRALRFRPVPSRTIPTTNRR